MNFGYLLSLVFWIMIARSDAEEITIKTSLGDVVGEQVDNYVIFRGIPYTENPPVGKYRFRLSKVKTTPYADGIYRALDDALFCIQPSDIVAPPGEQSEDCLYLTIFAPNIGIERAKSLAVMVFVHGGGLQYGAGSVYDARGFMRKSEVIFVAINFRGGPLGFLAPQSIYDETNGQSTGGMNGVHDQIVALQWVKNHISDFGGDPNKVTIFGESAGAASVCYLSLIPMAQGLFNQAIIQSGHCFEPIFNINTREDGLSKSLTYLDQIGISDNMESLRAADAFSFDKWFVTSASVDGYVLRDTTKDMLLNGEYKLNAEKMMIGTNNMDTLQIFPWFFAGNPAPQNDDEFDAYLKQYIADETNRDKIKNIHYPLDDFVETTYYNMFTSSTIEYSSQEMRWAVMNADVCYKCVNMFYTETIVKDSKISADNVYLYNLIGSKSVDYVSHGADLAHMFYDENAVHTSLWTNFTYYGITVDEATQSLSYYMTDAWTNFGAHREPKSNLNSEQWQAYGVARNAMLLGNDRNDATNGKAKNGYNVKDYYSSGYRNGACSFWMGDDIGWDTLSALCFELYSLEPTPPAPPVQPDDMDLVVNPNAMPMPSIPSPWDQSMWFNYLLMIGFVLIMYNIGCCYCIVNGRDARVTKFK